MGWFFGKRASAVKVLPPESLVASLLRSMVEAPGDWDDHSKKDMVLVGRKLAGSSGGIRITVAPKYTKWGITDKTTGEELWSYGSGVEMIRCRNMDDPKTWALLPLTDADKALMETGVSQLRTRILMELDGFEGSGPGARYRALVRDLLRKLPEDAVALISDDLFGRVAQEALGGTSLP